MSGPEDRSAQAGSLDTPHLIPVPGGSSAEVHVLVQGYVGRGAAVASTVSLVREGEVRAVVDPGMVPDRRAILVALEALEETAEGVTDVVLSHHHPDHTLNAALFPEARVHDHWAVYRDDRWEDRPAHGFSLAPSALLVATPGHTPECITTLAGTPDGVVALTHLWWNEDGPPEDPLAEDPEALHRWRRAILEVVSLVVPGHGPAFVPDHRTPR